MSLVIKNEFGHYIMRGTDNGTIAKTKDMGQAEEFATLEEAIIFCKCHVNRTKGYFVYDTVTQKICYRNACWKTNKNKRKTYSQSTRKLIYNNAGGRCELCGRKILFEDMTLDHVIPLSMGGADEVGNLSCVCFADNSFKGNILPSDFMERITEIFMYQMEKKYKNSIAWKMVHIMLKRMI